VKDNQGEPRFFARPEAWRRWLAANHQRRAELWVGFHKRATGRPSLTWPQAVDQALCFGWIDGVRKSIDETSYKIRFTPRRPGSIWSLINIRRVEELTRLGLMQPGGRAAFDRRKRSGVYSYEQPLPAELPPDYQARLRGDHKAWAYFQERPPWYRRTAIAWVVSAKREETRLRRLEALIRDSAAGRTIRPLTRPGG
jgi:uncharacterized protein YdeI (YjbR/CyaY-like superfamily)